MTQTRVRAWFTLGIWGLVGGLFAWIFFWRGGADTFPYDSLRVLMAAIILGLGFVGYLVMLRQTRTACKQDIVWKDERDEAIAHQANELALVAVLVFVFLASMGLYLSYESSGALPVGWMWALAYGCACFGLSAQALFTLVLYGRMDLDA